MSNPNPLALSIADQAFVNALAGLLVPVVKDHKRQDLCREVLREVRPAVSRDHPYVGPMVRAHGDWERADCRMMRERARMELCRLLENFFRWRAALAFDAFLKTQGGDNAAA